MAAEVPPIALNAEQHPEERLHLCSSPAAPKLPAALRQGPVHRSAPPSDAAAAADQPFPSGHQQVRVVLPGQARVRAQRVAVVDLHERRRRP
eukprot:CAMPEP_0194572076 /NCGR_PEP_ID=MMETSP0292-20121207/8805_1 /TAXON_ID=39354 /ORGANISM="Heterosigma akashiwo, Strain CCMP2393" /LENGTH=91 /DNA_ID=CAMNT_0039422991 /DNA_START=233 /DNA_END=505 /DNA_ORIENTATION=+